MSERETLPNIADIPTAEIHSITSTLLADSVPSDAMDVREMREWIEKRVNGIRYKGVNILTVDWDPVFEPTIDPMLTALLHSHTTDGVIVEYFTPELSKKVRHYPLVGSRLSHIIEQPIRNQNNTKGRPTYLNQYNRRLHTAKRISDVLAINPEKPVICVDIANKPLYMLMRDFSLLAESSIGFGVGAILDKIIKKQYNRNFDLTHIGGLWPVLMRVFQIGMQAFRKGMYDPEKISRIEQFQLHLEDARRLVVSEGVLQHVDRLTQGQTTQREPTYLMVYPRAHNLRIREYMKRIIRKDPSFPLKVKDIAYRLVSDPILEFQERQYRFAKEGWTQISVHPIRRMV